MRSKSARRFLIPAAAFLLSPALGLAGESGMNAANTGWIMASTALYNLYKSSQS